MSNANRSLLISADSHVAENENLRARLPEHLRGRMRLLVPGTGGDLDDEVNGEVRNRSSWKKLSARDRELEFRSDPSLGTDLDRRMRDMAREGVDAQVIFPNIGLNFGGSHQTREYSKTFARAYNEYAKEAFAPAAKRFKPAAMLPTDAIEDTLAEAQKCIHEGFATLFLPCVVPWQPYRLKVWEPLWSMAEEASIPITFHVFSGNLALGGEFADPGHMSEERLALTIEQGKDRVKHTEHLDTVIGMAAGMAPILELTSSGVLERHPGLRFVITESECGCLAWVLQAMDQMQRRRHLYRKDLPLRASEYFLRQGFVTITDDPVALNNISFTGADCLLWGNDYPHDEGSWPESQSSIEAIRASLGDSVDKVLHGNAADLYGFDLDYLATRQAEITALAS
ncbi:MAG: amidohydrolase family protein [Proteobacteria bacterium]|nr:amidohydrolase family protein [Pseudomonadota bacterium]